MSYLLEALKESQRGRDGGRGDPLFADKAIDSPRSENGNSGNSRKYLYVATLAVVLGVLGGWVYSVKEEAPGGAELPELTQSVDVSSVEVALAGADTASARVEAVESEQPEVNDTVLSPTQEEAIAKIRALYESDEINESKDTGQVAVAGKVVARDVAVVSGPVVSPDRAPPQRITSPVQDASVEESTMDESVDSSIPHLKTLPLAIQQEIGPMDFSVHIYSRKIPNRFVSINGTKSREGDRLKNGVLLESIVSSGAIFTYKGYRFWIPLG